MRLTEKQRDRLLRRFLGGTGSRPATPEELAEAREEAALVAASLRSKARRLA